MGQVCLHLHADAAIDGGPVSINLLGTNVITSLRRRARSSGKAQLGLAVQMANRIPAPMSFNPADRSERDPALVNMGVGHRP
jgi:hypothetical protein